MREPQCCATSLSHCVNWTESMLFTVESTWCSMLKRKEAIGDHINPPPHYLQARPHKTQLRNKHAELHRNVDRRYEEEHRANWCQFVKVKRALAKDYMASRMLIPTPKTTMVVPLYIHQQLYNTQPCEFNINARNRTSCPCRPHYELFRELFDRSQWPPSASSGFHLVECKPGG